MPAILIKKSEATKLDEKQEESLLYEFPAYRIFMAEKEVKESEREDVRIIYAETVEESDLKLFPALSWIHLSKKPQTLPLQALKSFERLLISYSHSKEHAQHSEYAFSTILYFSQDLAHFQEERTPYSLKSKKLVQVGLGDVGTEIARQAKNFSMQVLGIEKKASFHPHCKKVFSLEKLSSLLASTDILSIAIDRSFKEERWGIEKDLCKLKKGAIVLWMDPLAELSVEKLIKISNKLELKGIALDLRDKSQKNKLLSKIDKSLISVAAHQVKSSRKESYLQFLRNLRYFSNEQTEAMKNQVSLKSS